MNPVSTRLLTVLLAALLLACGEPSGPDQAEALCQRVSADLLELPPPASLLASRRSALAARMGEGVAVLAAGTANADPQNNGYRGDNNLYYLAGLDVPGSWLVLVASGGQVDSTILYLPETATSPTSPVLAREVTGVNSVRCSRALSPELRRLVPAGGPLHTHSSNPAVQDTLVQALRALAGVEARELSPFLSALRLVKDSAEIARLRTAADVTARALVDAVAVTRVGRNEADIAAAILAAFAARGATRASFPSIVASAGNALTLHYNRNDRQLTGDELVLIDVGAEYGRYAGDVTRTFPVGGRFSERQRNLYQLVLGAQQAAIAAVRPGTTMAALEQVSRSYLAANSGTLCGTTSCDFYFGHSLSHFLGLNVHDVGARSASLEPGMVLTIEPGLYLPAEGIGIRIEDDVLVTVTGSEVLSGAVPKIVTEVEAMFAARPAGARRAADER